MNTFMTGLIILFGAGACGLGAALFYRVRFYKQVDEIEHWKNDLENRHIQREISRVKGLNMTGETEKLFEKWRATWEEIITSEVENIVHISFDVEDFAAQFRFLKAKETLNELQNRIERVEDEITKILDEVNELVGSEEQNKKEIEELEGRYRDLKRTLLSHSYSFASSEEYLQLKLEQCKELFNQFKENTTDGNYLIAREIVLKAKAKVEDISVAIDELPGLFTEVNTNIPGMLHDLQKDYTEMVESGYILSHMEFEPEKEALQKQLTQTVALLSEAKHVDGKAQIELIREKIESIYTQFEAEYESRRFVTQETERITGLIIDFNEETKESKQLAEKVAQSYHLKPEDLEILKQVDKQTGLLVKRMEAYKERLEEKKIAYSVLSEDLRTLEKQIQEIKEQHKEFVTMLHDLRKEELEARESLDLVRRTISQSLRLCQRSYIPGVPGEFEQLSRKALSHVEYVLEALARKPINMNEVTGCLKKAEETALLLFDHAKSTVENAMLAEKVIQYGNRYRRQYGSIEAGLNQAEAKFRSYDYHGALETAATVIHQIDPEAMERFKSEVLVDELPVINDTKE